MRSLIRILLGSLLVLAASAPAREDDGQQKPNRRKERQEETAAAQPAGVRGKTRTQVRGAHRWEVAYPTPAAVTPRVRRPDSFRSTLQPKRRAAGKNRIRHANFHAQPKPQQAAPVPFDENRGIKGSEHWQGDKYAPFRSYRSHRHDRNWYHKHYHHIVLICGGYYYWHDFYWYPAWGYDSFYSYYVYDGPIYAGTVMELPDQLIADVQSALQELGYYDGEVDGILGELTQEAITAYQADNQLYQTGAIDQPTVESLGLN